MKFFIPIMALATAVAAVPTNSPPSPDVCFRVQGSNGKWLECDNNGPLNFKSQNKAGLFILDGQNQLRNAYNGALASRDPIGHKDYGYVEMNKNGKVDKNDDKLSCWRDNGILKCAVQYGDNTYEKLSKLYVGKNLEKESKHANKVTLFVKEEPCHRPNVWESWKF